MLTVTQAEVIQMSPTIKGLVLFIESIDITIEFIMR